ncbi:SDR family NAD(P)-dependent oxidoreductase [Simiduia curdlanivorans]|uniref:SDR family NAD(P)-dependent oxidoreductase n=1 Tax=Simiduia curdlanivorans TaxID=1492769 RepID=A0ABV8V860_9GAMM|nr:SDR family NAD(P)-dependent oxidoreductase [Simiduia curdlanivorans]MDN3638798.1 SDR family NAD(P)-dependent oxidoreductase [Simiduia curdlanivorans]
MKTDNKKTILITGATDGIGLATANKLVAMGHEVLLHGRNQEKLNAVVQSLTQLHRNAVIKKFTADFSELGDVVALANAVTAQHKKLDVLINNAGVLKTPITRTSNGLDVRFVVNTLAPYLFTQRLLPLMDKQARVINLSSAAQAKVNLNALNGDQALADMEAYAQSKLALTLWSQHMAAKLKTTGPIIIAVNPGSLLASKMVKEGFGITGNEINIGANILIKAAFDTSFATASGKYYDNDAQRFAAPQYDSDKPDKIAELIQAMEALLTSV